MAAQWKIHCSKAVAIGSKKIKMQFSILRENMHGLLYYRGISFPIAKVAQNFIGTVH